MSYTIYKLFHYTGLSLILVSLGVGLFRSAKIEFKKIALAHGLGMLLALVGGFGMLAKLGTEGVPGWVWAKVVIWLIMGAAMALVKRDRAPFVVWYGLVALTVAAASLAIYKPF